MKRMYCTLLSIALLSIVLLGVAGIAAATDPGSVAESCDGCHGDNGVSRWSDVPTIAGIDAFVHSEALFVYRDNARPCAESEFRQGDSNRAATNMCDIAAEMSDEEIEDIAAHYAALPFVAAAQDFDASLAETGQLIHNRECNRCHSDGGSNPEDEAGILAGQWMDYLKTTFAEYESGEREQPKKMKENMDKLKQNDVEALLHYYASQQ